VSILRCLRNILKGIFWKNSIFVAGNHPCWKYFPTVVARIKTRVLHILSRFRYLLILNHAVASSISRAEIEAAISRLFEIQAAVDHPTAENVRRVSCLEKGTHKRLGVSFSQLDPEPHSSGVSGNKENGCPNLGNHSGMSSVTGTVVSGFSHGAPPRVMSNESGPLVTMRPSASSVSLFHKLPHPMERLLREVPLTDGVNVDILFIAGFAEDHRIAYPFSLAGSRSFLNNLLALFGTSQCSGKFGLDPAVHIRSVSL
jgi:hypothetical protein